MWGPIIEFWGKKDVNSSEKKLDFVDNDLDELFDNAIQKLDMEIDNLQQIKKYLIHMKEEISKHQKFVQFTDYPNSHKNEKVLFKARRKLKK